MLLPNRWSRLGFLVLVLVGAQVDQALAGDGPAGFAVVAYLPDYRLDRVEPGKALGVTDVVFFSIEASADGSINSRRLSGKAIRVLKRFKKENGARTHVAVGGWERSGGFARLSQEPRARGKFVAELVQLCSQHELDGVDLDWEHPKNDAENAGYAALLSEIKAAFTPRKLLLSAALADWQDPGPKAYAALDRIHVMAYDHEGPRHSTLDQAKADAMTFVKRGVPREKIRLGLPFYGRRSDDSKVEASYAELFARYHPKANVDNAGGFYFNGPEMIARKTRWARDERLGGVMIWELGQDVAGTDSLLGAIHGVK